MGYKNEICIPMSNGNNLIARGQKGSDYPGIWVYFSDGRQETLIAVVGEDTVAKMVRGFLYNSGQEEPEASVTVESATPR